MSLQHKWNDKDLNNLQKLEIQYKAKLITTEKDFLRMNSFIRKKYSYIKIEIKFDDEEGFYNRIKKIVLWNLLNIYLKLFLFI